MSTSSGGWTYKASIPGDANAAAAMAAFQQYRAISIQMDSKPDYSTNLSSYADSTVLTLDNNFVQVLKRGDQAMVGTLSETVSVANVNMNAAPLPLVTLSVCLNEVNYHEVFVYGPRKGQLATADFTHSFPVTYTVHKSSDGKWRVTGVKAEADKTC